MNSYLPPDPYKLLGVARDAKLAEIRSAHRKSVLKCHPDKVQDAALKAVKQDEFQKVQQAYELLSDDAKRQQYDSQVKLFELRMEMGRGNPSKGSHFEPPLKAKEQGLGQWNVERMKPLSRPRNKPTGILVVQGHINGRKTQAIPDTGAEGNIMAASFARDIGLTIQNQNPSQLLRMANGKHIETIGTVQAVWSFVSDPVQNWKITFQVLADFVYDLVLGSAFLTATQTMSYHQHRLCRIPRPLQSLSVLRVNILGSGCQRVLGIFQGNMMQALPDSGSEANLVSLDYVKRHGWLPKIKREDQNMLQFADGSTEKTEGSIMARWRFLRVGDDDPETSLRVKLHVLRGCVYNVILGQDVLEDADAFLRHEKAFLDMASSKESLGLNLVIWLPKARRKTLFRSSRGNQSDIAIPEAAREGEGLHSELQRRAAADRNISRMPSGNEREAAIATETEMRRTFDTSQRFTNARPEAEYSSL